MRDDHVRRYARHILVPDIGGLGQTALLSARARMEMRESEPDAELVAAMYLVAGGVGTLVLGNATDAQRAVIAQRGPDTAFDAGANAPRDAIEVVLQPKPAWWPTAAGDAIALAYWRGGIAATRWMATIANS